MGKGDKKSKRGKISMGSYGKTRPSKTEASKPEAKPEAK
ncbi:30S ribosomal protein THX [Spirosoma taeanense]|uniref:30S ribosomal protein THX n=1 Tax=Spirosoma taeanense TaxID=2735870 RepID=A0A6M5Y667_9BACT|nr:30S ribosomal protein THX [Spirosoma taeanense]